MTGRMQVFGFSPNLSSDDLKTHILRSYLIMRLGIAAIGVVFPFILLFGGQLDSITWQDSMSAYYHAENATGGSMRNWFVGLLFAVAISLGLYRGFSRIENWLLNFAAIFGVMIALFPMPWTEADMIAAKDPITKPFNGAHLFGVPYLTVHGVSAVCFFLCIALVCWFCADDTLSLIDDAATRQRLKYAYRFIAILMPTAMFAAWILFTVSHNSHAIFVTEAVGIVAFGSYWALKGWELNQTAADLLVVSGMVSDQKGVITRGGTGDKEPPTPKVFKAGA